MKKIIIGLVILVLVVIGAGMFFFAGKLDDLIRQAIETEGSLALGSPVRVESVVTDLAKGKATINGLSIANPGGYTDPNAIEIGTFSADVDYRNQIVEEILIDQPTINAEQIGQKNNFQDLLDRMPASPEETTTEEETSDDIQITIKRLALQKATINLRTSELNVADQPIELGDRSFVMDDFILTDLTGNVETISNIVINSLTAHVSGQVKDYVADELKQLAADKVVEEVTEKVNEVLEEQLGGEVGEQLDGELGDKLKDFGIKFGKKKDKD